MILNMTSYLSAAEVAIATCLYKSLAQGKEKTPIPSERNTSHKGTNQNYSKTKIGISSGKEIVNIARLDLHGSFIPAVTLSHSQHGKDDTQEAHCGDDGATQPQSYFFVMIFLLVNNSFQIGSDLKARLFDGLML